MKEISAEILSPAAAEKSWPAVLADLVKARLTTLVLLTTLVGFYLGWNGTMNFVLMFNTLAANSDFEAGGLTAFKITASFTAGQACRIPTRLHYDKLQAGASAYVLIDPVIVVT